MIISIREASGITGISESTIYKHIKKGILPAHRQRNRWFIDKTDLFCYYTDQWNEGRILMFPPDLNRFERGLEFFCKRR